MSTHPTESGSSHADSDTRQEKRLVEFEPGSLENPQNFPLTKKWIAVCVATASVLAVTFASSAYAASPEQIMGEFDCSEEAFALGISLYVLGFAVGPPLWAPLSELYGRRICFLTTQAGGVAFVAAAAGSNSMATLLLFRLIAGTFAASPIVNLESDKVFATRFDENAGSPRAVFLRAWQRPWALLFREPIVLAGSAYLAILYGILYMFLEAFPVVYGSIRGWNQGQRELPFLGLVVGMACGFLYCIMDDHYRYKRLSGRKPESRLMPAAVGDIALPIGLFGFAWTSTTTHWAAGVVLCAPFGLGCVLVFLAVLNYLVDAYTIYAASVLAAGAMLRAFFGTAFPLFGVQMYANLGVPWATSIPAFLTVGCLPFPFLMLKYGPALRLQCKYAHEAAMLMMQHT